MLWCDHRAHKEAKEITELAHATGLEAIEWCGGVYSHEWGFAKLLYWLRHNPDKRERFATALEHCDMVAATLIGITDPKLAPRSVCAMGHKWMWNPRWEGLPSQDFLSQLDPLLDGVREKLAGEYRTSDAVAGGLSERWAAEMGLKAGIPIPVGAFDAHWDAIGAGCREGDVVNVVGTSTCIIAMARETELVPGVCGVVPGSVHPGFTGIEAGLSATGDIFEAIARRAGTDVKALSEGLAEYKPGQTGLLRLSWDNGDRTVLVNPELGGMTLGWNLLHTAKDELFAAIEGTAFHTRLFWSGWRSMVCLYIGSLTLGDSAEQCGVEPGVCGCAGQAGAGAGWGADDLGSGRGLRWWRRGCLQRLKRRSRRCVWGSRCMSRRLGRWSDMRSCLGFTGMFISRLGSGGVRRWGWGMCCRSCGGLRRR